MISESLSAQKQRLRTFFSHHPGRMVLVFLIVGCVLCALPPIQYWLRDGLANLLDNATKGTPLEGTGSYVRPNADVTGPAAPDFIWPVNLDGTKLPEGVCTTEGTKVVGRVLEDDKLKKDVVRDLAVFLVTSFSPKAEGSICSLQLLNQYLGSRVNTAEKGGRSALMRYIFQPTMLRGIYHLYVSYFFETIASVLTRKGAVEGFGEDDMRRFYALMEDRLGALAQAVTALLTTPECAALLDAYEKLDDACENLTTQITMATYDLQQMKDEDAAAIDVRARRTELETEARAAMRERDEALHAFCAALSLEHDAFLTEETLLFLARWLNRRLAESSQAGEALEAAVQILFDLQIRFRQYAEGRLPITPTEAVLATEEEVSEATLLRDTVPQEEARGESRGESRRESKGAPEEEDVHDGLPQTIQIPIS